MSEPLHGERYLTQDEIQPEVYVVQYWRFPTDKSHRFRQPGHQFMLVEEGEIRARMPHVNVRAVAADLICFHPGGWMEYDAPAGTLVYATTIFFAPPPGNSYPLYLDGVGPIPDHLSLEAAAVTEMRSHFETLCVEVPRPGAVHQMRVRMAIFGILSVVAAAIKPVDADETIVAPPDPWQRLRLRIDSDARAKLDVAALARSMRLSTDHFIRTFKQRFGMSPKAYHSQLKMQEAMRRLRGAGVGAGAGGSIKEIAYDLGFRHPRSFTRRFREHFGITPSEVQGFPTISTEPAAPIPGRLYPLNTHIVPPTAKPDWESTYYPPAD